MASTTSMPSVTWPNGGVLAVQEGAVLMYDEELGRSAVRVIGAGHGDGAAYMGNIIFHAVLGEFSFDGCIRPPVPFPFGSPP